MEVLVDLLQYFLIYAFVGWCLEVIYAAVTLGTFVNRGFLAGPVCPIYGFGMVIIILSLTPLSNRLLLLFGASVLLTSGLEFVAGLILERVFNDKWWDYTDEPFNLCGYVCLKFSLLWGIAVVFVMKIVHPVVEQLVHLMPDGITGLFLLVGYGLVLTDLSISIATIIKIKQKVKLISDIEGKLRAMSDSLGQTLSDGVAKTMEIGGEKKEELLKFSDEKKEELRRLREKLETHGEKEGESIFMKRLYRAYPKLADNVRKRTKLSADELTEKIKTVLKKIGKE